MCASEIHRRSPPKSALRAFSSAGFRATTAAARKTTTWAIVAAALVFALAYVSPVETVDSDPALALLASQSLIDHGTLRLDPYQGRPELAYHLETDYRVRHYKDAYYPNSLGVPILSVPAVWIANRLGLHMLDQKAEFATQNALSAMCCALLFMLLFRLCRLYLGGAESLTIAAVSTLGTSVMSTGATGLWSSDYALIFVSLALLHLARRSSAADSRLNLPYLAALVALGFACRPVAGLFGVALLTYLLFERNRLIALAAAVALAVVGLAVALPRLVPWPWMAGNYAPSRLRIDTPLGPGLYGVLVSPSRGLLVFSPFIALVAAWTIRCGPRLRRDRLFWLCVVWIVLHTLATAVRSKWWGGHSFGPRLMVDVIPAFVMLTCLAWRDVRENGSSRTRRGVMTAYLALAAGAVAIHTGQGLFNPATRLWNVEPDIDREPGLALDWQYPQFLASANMLEARWEEYDRREAEDQRRRLAVYEMGTPIRFDSRSAVFVHWYQAEGGWRWTRGDASSVVLRLPHVDPRLLHLLELLTGALGTQRVDVSVNAVRLGMLDLEGFDPRLRLVEVPGSVLRPDAENVIEFGVSNPSSTASDARRLGMSLRYLKVLPLAADFPEVTYADDRFFGQGFSVAENGWRWTDGTRAQISYPVGAVAPGVDHVLEIDAGAHGTQRAGFLLNGSSVGHATVAGFEPTSITLRFPGALLRPAHINLVELRLPDAVSAPGDRRQLGLALRRIRIAPVPPANDAGRYSGPPGGAGRGKRGS